jgi:hypothetical protein
MRPGSLDPGNGMPADPSRHKLWAGAGAVALIPAFLLVATGFAGIDPPRLVDSPVLVMGGLAIAIGLGLMTVTHWEIRSQLGEIRISCTIQKRVANLVVLATGLGLLAIITVYLFLENFQPR